MLTFPILFVTDVARRKGILMVEGARNMEKLNEISHIVMDKTGTVTEGQLHMAACDLEDSWCDRWEELSVLVCAAEERNGVARPAGLAVFRGCLQNIQSQWRKYKEFGGLKNLEEVVGQGLRCDVDVGDSSWRRICLGNAMFLSSMGIQIVEQPHLQAAKEALNVYVAIDDEFAGVFRLQVSLIFGIIPRFSLRTHILGRTRYDPMLSKLSKRSNNEV